MKAVCSYFTSGSNHPITLCNNWIRAGSSKWKQIFDQCLSNFCHLQHFCLGNENRNSLSHAKGPVQAAVPLPSCLSFVEHSWYTYAFPKIFPWPHQVLPAQSQAVIADLQTTQMNAGLGWSRRSPPEYKRWSQLCSVSNTVQLSKSIFTHGHLHYWRII